MQYLMYSSVVYYEILLVGLFSFTTVQFSKGEGKHSCSSRGLTCLLYSMKHNINQCSFQDFTQGGKHLVPKFKGGG